MDRFDLESKISETYNFVDRLNDISIPSNTLISYSRNSKGDPRGVLVAIKSEGNGNFNIGYAQCRKGDRFSKKMGLKIALGRAELDTSFSSLNHAPHNLRKMLPSFIQRCEKYYKIHS